MCQNPSDDTFTDFLAHLQVSLQLLDLLKGLLRGAFHVLCLQCGKFARLPDVPLGIPVPHDLPDLLQVVNVLQIEKRSWSVRRETTTLRWSLRRSLTFSSSCTGLKCGSSILKNAIPSMMLFSSFIRVSSSLRRRATSSKALSHSMAL